MKTYVISSPSIDGILSDDYLYFEGVSRPADVYAVRDSGLNTQSNIEVLEKYFNDIYNLFLRKLSSFSMFDYIGDDEATKMQALLQELIKVKKLIENAENDVVDSD